MSTIINATTTNGVVIQPDNSGSLVLQTNNGTAALTIDTSQRAAFVAGTAALPAITTTGDTNTGIFFPAADTIAFAEGGTEAMRIDSSGNVGIGTTSPSSYASATRKVLSINNTDNVLTLGSYYELGIAQYSFINSSNVAGSGNIALVFSTGSNTERMRIDSSGNVLVGAASQFSGFVANAKLYTESSTADFITHFRNTNGTAANAFGLALSYSTAPNGTSNAFLDARDSSAQRAAIRSNGGLANFSANNVNLSDERLKTDITPAKSYLDTICSIPVVTFKYNDQTDEELNLGVIAQAVDTVAPELVDHSGFGEAPEGESPYLAIYQTDLQYALMKCIQEQQTIINDLKARIETLEAK